MLIYSSKLRFFGHFILAYPDPNTFIHTLLVDRPPEGVVSPGYWPLATCITAMLAHASLHANKSLAELYATQPISFVRVVAYVGFRYLISLSLRTQSRRLPILYLRSRARWHSP